MGSGAPVFGDADLRGMMQDWKQSITVKGVTRACIVDERDDLGELAQGTEQIKRLIVATIRTADFPAIAQNDVAQIGAVQYTVWRSLLMGDGGTTELWLRKT